MHFKPSSVDGFFFIPISARYFALFPSILSSRLLSAYLAVVSRVAKEWMMRHNRLWHKENLSPCQVINESIFDG